MTHQHPSVLFPDFSSNRDIRLLGRSPRWTISANLGNQDDSGRKAPIDIRHLMRGCTDACRHTGILRGAFALDDTCLMTLDELNTAVPNAANNAFYLRADTDGLVVVDIEPGCPGAVASDLLRLPGVLYSEMSMSGRGFHLLLAPPTNLHEHPVAATKRVLRHPEGWYEILFDHWVTFTRKPVTEAIRNHVDSLERAPSLTSLDEVYDLLAREAAKTASASATTIDTSSPLDEDPAARELIENLLVAAHGQYKDLSDFSEDHSRWEFSVLGILHARLAHLLGTSRRWSTGDRAWVLFKAAQHVIPHRPKHDQLRNGRPFLLDRAAALVAERVADTDKTSIDRYLPPSPRRMTRPADD